MRPQDFEKLIKRFIGSAVGNASSGAQLPTIPAYAIRTAPAAALAHTDAGPVLVLSPEALFGRTAREIRLSGLVVPTNIPDDAEVVRDDAGRSVFRWADLQS